MCTKGLWPPAEADTNLQATILTTLYFISPGRVGACLKYELLEMNASAAKRKYQNYQLQLRK